MLAEKLTSGGDEAVGCWFFDPKFIVFTSAKNYPGEQSVLKKSGLGSGVLNGLFTEGKSRDSHTFPAFQE